jgi:hypothetical protein
LNHQVVERLRFLRDVRAHHHMQDLRIGDQVSFSSEVLSPDFRPEVQRVKIKESQNFAATRGIRNFPADEGA